jgi:xanthine dehydrogenase accessory factor
MKRSTREELREAQLARRAMVRALDLASGEERLLDPRENKSLLGQAAAEAARSDKSGFAEIEGRSWFFEVHNPPLDLRLIGAVHIAQPLARMAQLAAWRVRVVDPRSAFATEERFPGIEISRDWPDEALANARLGMRSALIALTHDPKIDDPALVAALRSECFYIGALGSKKTHAARLARLAVQGFTDKELARIHGPVGLAIGARSPPEIAISILAEMTMRLRTDGGWERSVVRATANTGISPRS